MTDELTSELNSDMKKFLAVVGIARNGLAALLWLQSATTTMDVYSTLNSSPSTAERFGNDPKYSANVKEYVFHAVAWTFFYNIVAAILAGSWWPIIGCIVNNVYLVWLYYRALSRGVEANT